MKMIGPIIAVEDEKISRMFYEDLLSQKLKFDFEECQQFESGLTLQRKSSMKQIFTIDPKTIISKSNSVVIYFETEDFDDFIKRLQSYQNIIYVHDIITFNWGQQSVSFYDLDGYIVDVSESMESVCRRFYQQGMSIDEVVERTQHPRYFVEAAIEEQ